LRGRGSRVDGSVSILGKGQSTVDSGGEGSEDRCRGKNQEDGFGEEHCEGRKGEEAGGVVPRVCNSAIQQFKINGDTR